MATFIKSLAAATILVFGGLAGCKGEKPAGKLVPSNAEPRVTRCGALQATGVQPGQVPPNIALEDGDGNVVQLHDYCDKTVLLIAGTMF